MNDEIFIHWFRQDLRISDNPSLNFYQKNMIILLLFIFSMKLIVIEKWVS